jgi:hypothetical protein
MMTLIAQILCLAGAVDCGVHIVLRIDCKSLHKAVIFNTKFCYVTLKRDYYYILEV